MIKDWIHNSRRSVGLDLVRFSARDDVAPHQTVMQSAKRVLSQVICRTVLRRHLNELVALCAF